MLLGCLMKNPELLYNPSYPLSKEDFSPIQMHKIIFNAIVKLSLSGANIINEIEIDTLVKNYPAAYEILQDSDWLGFIDVVKELSSTENYELYYTIVRKFALLRDLKNSGFNITEYYDEMMDEESQMAKFNSLSIQQILNDIELQGAQLRNKYDIHYVRDEIKAGEHTKELIDSFKDKPAFGALMQSGYLSTIFNGWNRGHLIIRAGPSSSGKTRCSIADLCQVGITHLWDEKEKDFIPNQNYQSPTLFIATEQDIQTEVEPMFLAAVSGVEYRSIINGTLSNQEENRVIKAGEIIHDSNLTICSMPNFTSKSLDRKIKEQVELNGVQYLVFDYMEVQSELSAEYKNNSAVAPRQDLILLSLTSDLKRYAEDYKVGILTGMQLNDSWKEKSFIDESCLAGSKAAKNKIDCGSILIPTSYLKKDLKVIEPYCNRKHIGTGISVPYPNICEFIFKSRYGIYGDQRLKLWSYFDRGTFRRYDFFVTDDTNNIIRIPLPKVEYKGG